LTILTTQLFKEREIWSVGCQ